MSDGNLRKLFQQHMPQAHWQAVETWSTGQGVPDCEFCFPNGRQGWIENKLTAGWQVKFETGQVAWLTRRARMGGRCFIAVRRKVAAGPRRGIAVDQLWLFLGADAMKLSVNGIKPSNPIGFWEGGPAKWDWERIKDKLSL